MKKTSREINIFSMSALDLFASALGVFILITVVLLPFFPYTAHQEALQAERARSAALQEQLAQAQAELTQAQAELAQAQAELTQAQAGRDAQSQLDSCEANLEQTQEELQECSRIAKRTFVLAVMSWGTQSDVDLHVLDPSGRHYYYRRESYSGSPAELEVDNTRGPGNEIWLHPSATAGKYTIAYDFFSQRGWGRSRVEVRGLLLTQETKVDFPEITLRGEEICG